MPTIFPVIDRLTARKEISRLERRLLAGQQILPRDLASIYSKASFPAVGGTPVDSQTLRLLRDEIVDSLPGETHKNGQEAWKREFDVRIGSAFCRWFTKSEVSNVSNIDVWPYLTTILMPDIACMRFGLNSSGLLPPERFMAGRRNVFYRAYLRSLILGDVLEMETAILFEDDLVGLIDRNFSVDHRLTRAIATGFGRHVTREKHRSIVRETLKLVQYEMRITDLASLTDRQLSKYIDFTIQTASHLVSDSV